MNRRLSLVKRGITISLLEMDGTRPERFIRSGLSLINATLRRESLRLQWHAGFMSSPKLNTILTQAINNGSCLLFSSFAGFYY